MSEILFSPVPGEPVARKQEECKVHGTYESKQWWSGRYWTHCPTCLKEKLEEDEAAAKAQEQERAQRRFQEAMQQSNIPKMYQGASFENFLVAGRDAILKEEVKTATKDFADNFAEHLGRGTSLLLIGKTGTGKTHLACAVANHVLQLRYRALVTTQEGILNSIQAGFSEGSPKIGVNHYIVPELLVVDEFGMGRETAFGNSTFFEVCDGRYANNRPTIFISNLTRPQLEKAVGDRIISRLRDRNRDNQIITFDFGDYRIGS